MAGTGKGDIDRGAWIAQVKEAAIAPDVPIIDPHFHFFTGRGVDYLAADFLREIEQGHRVVGAIHVEANADFFAHGGAAGEMLLASDQGDALARLCAAGGRSAPVVGAVGYTDLRRPDAMLQVEILAQASGSKLRGIRNSSAWDPDPSIKSGHTSPPPGLLADQAFRNGLRNLAAQGLTFDAYCFFPQLPELADLARAVPEASIVCDHLGGIIGIGPYKGRHSDFFAQWRRDIRQLALCPNVVLKLGGMAMSAAGFGWHKRDRPLSSDEYAAHYAGWFHTAIDAFGPSRCMFESNFPVDGVAISYGVLWNAFKKIAARYSPDEQSALLMGTAARAYRLQADLAT